MQSVRLGIIGLGNIGSYHAEYLLGGKVDRCKLVAVSDPDPAKTSRYPLCTAFDDGERLIHSGVVDGVIIATPHYQHTTLGIAALEAGVHAMVEKPISSHKADALRLIAAHRANPNVLFAGMFQQRVEPRYLLMRKMIDGGELGTLVRINWINTDWYRTEAYYSSGGWRATWKGEGGGLLLNQCLHNLDMLQWLFGMPSRVRGFCQIGRFHDIEVEDNVTAYLEWDAGASGTFISSTGEAPGTNRLEIVGSKGKLVLENDRLIFTRNDVDSFEFSRTCEKGFSKPNSHTSELVFATIEKPHAVMVQNFVNAILDGEPLIVPGEEGIASVELANALVFSSLLGRTLELPMDADAWERKLRQLIESSRATKKVVRTLNEDFAASFRK